MTDDDKVTAHLGDIARDLKAANAALVRERDELTRAVAFLSHENGNAAAALKAANLRETSLHRQLEAALRGLTERADELAALSAYLDGVGVIAGSSVIERVRYVIAQSAIVYTENLRLKAAQTKPLSPPTKPLHAENGNTPPTGTPRTQVR